MSVRRPCAVASLRAQPQLQEAVACLAGAIGGRLQGLAYYGYLASAVPASELASLPWRRLRRATLRALDDLARPMTVRDIVSAMGAGSIDNVARRLRASGAGRVAIEPNERAEARHLAALHLPGHAQAVTGEADALLRGELMLFGHQREHSRDDLVPGIAAIDWNRDPLSGAHGPLQLSRTIDRDARGTDSRAIWEAARLGGLLRLAQAHVLRGLPGTEGSRGAHDPSVYVRALELHIRDFVATQPVGFGIHWTCAMEVALRLLNLVPAVLLVRDAPELDSCFWGEFAETVLAHTRFIESELEDTQTVPGNHLLSDLAGLIAVACLLPDLPGAARWRERGLHAFSEELLRQSTPGGLAFEASLPYHRFTTELALSVQATARRQGLSLEPAALNRLWLMCEFVEGATLPDGLIPSVGDNDSTRAFSVIPRPSLQASHLSALRAALGGPGFPATVEPESLWLGGVAGLRRNIAQATVPRLAHLPSQHRFSRSGLVVLSDDEGRGVTLWAGENGQHGLGGHAHNDKLSSEVVLRSHRLTIDPGCPTYLVDPAERDRYRSTAAHPTVQIDHFEQADIPADRPFLLPEAAHATVLRVDDHEAAAEHRGYLRVRPGVLHRREVALPPRMPDVVCITDWLLGEGNHVVDVRWPLTTVSVTIRSATIRERTLLIALEATPWGQCRFDQERVFAVSPEPGTCALIAVACEQPWEAVLTEGAFSTGYGERACNRVVGIRLRAECPFAVTSAFVWVTPH